MKHMRVEFEVTCSCEGGVPILLSIWCMCVCVCVCVCVYIYRLYTVMGKS